MIMNKNKSKAIARKQKSIAKKQSYIDKEAKKLFKKLGADKYEQLRTGKVELDMNDSRTVTLINKRAEDISRKRKAIDKKMRKSGMLNYQGDK